MNQTLLEEFYNKHGYTPLKKDTGVVDPKAKSEESLLDKVKRNIEMGRKNKDFVLGDIPDMARCTIICDSYESMPERIQQLKSVFPNMTGYISRCPNGYRGVHLNIMVEGIKAEIQLCTSKSFEYGQAAEHIYKKWRSFSPENFSKQELREKIAAGEFQPSEKVSEMLSSGDEKNIDAKLLIELSAEQKEEYAETERLFEELHSDGSFRGSEREIESLLLSYKASAAKTESRVNPKFLKKFAVDGMGRVDTQKAKKYIMRVHKDTTQIQSKFIDLVKKSENSKSGKAETDEKTVAGISAMLGAYDSAYTEKVNSNPELDFNKHLIDYSIGKSNVAVEFSKYCESHGIDVSSLTEENINDFIDSCNITESEYAVSKEELKSSAKKTMLRTVQKVSITQIREEQEKNGMTEKPLSISDYRSARARDAMIAAAQNQTQSNHAQMQ